MPARDHRPTGPVAVAPRPAARPTSPVAAEQARAEAARAKAKQPVKRRRRGFFARLFGLK
jgi:hypothetical protein